MWSASSPWPHASWNKHAAGAPLQHDGQAARGRGDRLEQRERAPGGTPTDLFGDDRVEQLEAHGAPGRLVAGLHPGVAGRDTLDRHPRAHPVVVGDQAVRVRDEDAAPRVGVRRGDRSDRGAGLARCGIGPGQELDLATLLHAFRHDDAGVEGMARRRPERDGVGSAATTAGRAGRGLGGQAESLGRQIGSVRKSGRIAPDDAQPRAPVATRDELLDASLVEAGAGRPPILDEHLREIATTAQRVVERGLQDIVFDHGSGHVRLEHPLIAPTCRVDAGLPMVSGWDLPPVSPRRSR